MRWKILFVVKILTIISPLTQQVQCLPSRHDVHGDSHNHCNVPKFIVCFIAIEHQIAHESIGSLDDPITIVVENTFDIFREMNMCAT